MVDINRNSESLWKENFAILGIFGFGFGPRVQSLDLVLCMGVMALSRCNVM